MWDKIYAFTEVLWGTPLMILMVGTGLYLSVRTGFFQFTGFGLWWRKTIGEVFGKSSKSTGQGEMKPFEAMCTVLAGTVGAGTISGVASAIAVGGPGAVFWMWVIALVGMMTKMTEVTLAVHYRKESSNGEYYGGPMYYIKEGLGPKWKFLAGIYVVALLVLVLTDAGFVQANTLATCVNDVFGVPLIVSGVCISGLTVIVVASGGVKKIGDFCGKLVPVMILIYIVASVATILFNVTAVPSAFATIFKYAFAPAPAVGGFVGSTVSMAMARGASRGIFSNEAGMGTATVVHATASTDHPVHQGMYGVLEVFIVSFVICTLTALSIITTGVWSNGNTGVVLSFDAFRSVWGFLGLAVLAIAVALFAYSSYLGFFVEFRSCLNYIFGEKLSRYLKWFYFIPPLVSVTLDVEVIWDLADMAV